MLRNVKRTLAMIMSLTMGASTIATPVLADENADANKNEPKVEANNDDTVNANVEENEKEETETSTEGGTTPVENERPKTPVEGETPQTPENGETPTTPVEGETPQTPENGGIPQTPVENETPQTPENGGTPTTPIEGETPQTPENGTTQIPEENVPLAPSPENGITSNITTSDVNSVMDNKLISLFPYWGQNENELKYDADILYEIEGVISTNYHTQAKYVWIKGNDVYVAVSSEDNKPVQQAKIGDYYYDEIERANIITVTFDDKAKVNQEEAPGKNGSNECVWSIIKFSGAYSNFDLSDLNIYVNVQGNSSGTQGHELNITGKNLEMIAPEAPEVDIEDIDVILKCITDGSNHKDIVGYPKDDCLVGQNMAVSLVTGEPTYNEDTQKWEVIGSLSDSQLKAFKATADEEWGQEHTLVNTSTNVTFEYNNNNGTWTPVGEGIEDGQLVLQYTHEEGTTPSVEETIDIDVILKCITDGSAHKDIVGYPKDDCLVGQNMAVSLVTGEPTYNEGTQKWEVTGSLSSSQLEAFKAYAYEKWGTEHTLVSTSTDVTFEYIDGKWIPVGEGIENGQLVLQYTHEEHPAIPNSLCINVAFECKEDGEDGESGEVFKHYTLQTVANLSDDELSIVSVEKNAEGKWELKVSVSDSVIEGLKESIDSDWGGIPHKVVDGGSINRETIFTYDETSKTWKPNDETIVTYFEHDEQEPVEDTFTITFNAGDHGTFKDGTKVSVEERGSEEKGKEIGETPKIDIEPGYEFAGWKYESEEPEGEEPVIYEDDDVKQLVVGNDIEFTAVYRKVETPPVAKEYTVIFNAGDGHFSDNEKEVSTKVKEGSHIEKVPVATYDENNAFSHWVDENGKVYYTEDSIKGLEINSDKVFTAVYVDPYARFTVTFNNGSNGMLIGTNGEAESIQEEVLKSENVLMIPAVKANEEYKFKGWYMNDDTTKIYDDNFVMSYDIYEDTTFTAVYEKIETEEPQETASVTFNTDGNGTLDGETEFTITKGSNVESVPTVIPKTGYEFKGWAINGNTGTLIDTDSVIKTTISENTTFTAIFELAGTEEPQETVVVTFDTDGNGTLDGETEFTITKGSNVTSVPKATPNTGYEFKGWAINGNTGTLIDTASVTKTTINENTTFTAIFELAGQTGEDEDSFTVTFNGGEYGTLTGETEYTIGEDGKITETPTVNPNTGYEFSGWYCEETRETYTEDELKDLDVEGDLNFTAQYEQITNIPDVDTPTSSGGGASDDYDVDQIFATPVNDDNDGNGEDGTTILDEDTALANLNLDDHFGYVVGYPDGTIRPNDYISREEVATIFFRLLDDESRAEFWSTKNSYSDTDPSDWSNNAVSTLEKSNIISGYTDGTFKGKNYITRAEFATIAARFDDTPYVGEDLFSDISGHWAEEYINRAANRGWIKGYEDGIFAPDQFITRAEAFTLINAVLGRTPSDSKLSDDMITFIDNPQGTWYYAQVQEATNSHNIEENTENGEVWTETVPMRDWKAIESPSNKNFIPDPYADDDVTTDDNSEDTTSDDVTE